MSHYKSALDFLEEENSTKTIVTFCKDLDDLLGGGIRQGLVTEIVGLPGVGKTTFCLQLCLDVQTPKVLHGNEGESIYIGTDHSLSISRLSEMAKEFVSHCNKVITSHLSGKKSSSHLLKIEDILSKIHIAKCCDADELVRIILSLESFLVQNPKVKLLVIDSIAFPFYAEKEQFSNRVKVLFGIGQILFELIDKFGLAIVLTNNLTTRFGEGDSADYLVPFLGDGWSNIPNQRLKFVCNPGSRSRTAELLKSTTLPLGVVNYRIVSSGFRK